MAARYSGNVELRISLHRMRGWNGKMGWFYKARVSCPGHKGTALLSPREAGIPKSMQKNLRDPENFDRAAEAILTLADQETRGLVGREAERGGARRWTVLRVQQAPCPVVPGERWVS